MKDITLENLNELVAANTKTYKDHIDKCGEPIIITLTLLPWEDGLKFEARGNIPDELKTMNIPAIIKFTYLIKEQIIQAITPPGS